MYIRDKKRLQALCSALSALTKASQTLTSVVALNNKFSCTFEAVTSDCRQSYYSISLLIYADGQKSLLGPFSAYRAWAAFIPLNSDEVFSWV